MKIGIIREGKVPPDSRVPLIPEQCASVLGQYEGLDIVVQPSPGRCYPNEAYRHHNISLTENIEDCEVLMGVKEVPIEQLIPNKTYFFFSHTIKEQPYNRQLLQAILEKNIRLIDYEVLTNERGKRLIAFGKFAGMVGAHNGIMTYGQRTGLFDLIRMNECLDYAEARKVYKKMKWPPMKVVLTGTGRVGKGAALVLQDMGLQEVEPDAFLNEEYKEAVFTVLACADYAARKDGKPFQKQDFYRNPSAYKSIFAPYASVADVMINGIYWDNDAPAFFTIDEMQSNDFNIQVVADVTCDIAPISSIPSTLRPSTIPDPVFGFNPETGEETEPYQPHSVDMMTIDNLPNELPRDASKAFGQQFIEFILPELLKPNSKIIERATVAADSKLGLHFQYLKEYVEGAEV